MLAQALPAPSLRTDPSAALAEAWHVDGAFARAARAWSELALQGREPAEAALKAAIAWFAAGDEAAGARWLLRARRAGTPAAEIRYVVAQRHWARGKFRAALRTLRRAQRSGSASPRETTLLGVYEARLGRAEQARALFERAAARGDACALVDRVSLAGAALAPAAALESLARAAAAEPQRFEPYVLCSRLARREPGLGPPALYLERARLRRRGLTVPAQDAEPAEPAAELDRASYLVRRAGSLWRELVPDAALPPPQLVVARDASWLAEALTAYELHLAQDAGLLPDYRAATLRTVRELGGGRLARQGLAALARLPGRAAADALRAKGGFVVAALRAVVGEDAFVRLLRDVFGLDRAHPLDTYLFFALASRAHGASLNWFARQWVCEPAELVLAAEAEAAPAPGGGYRLALRARCLGVAVPGAAVTYAVDLADGTTLRHALNLDLGLRDAALELPARPLRVRPDPDARWYASTVAARLESCRELA